MNIGYIYKETKSLYLALEYFQKSLAITVKHYGEGHFETANPLNNIGLVYKK